MELKNLINLEKLINSELANKIVNSKIENEELLITTTKENLEGVIKFLKNNEKSKFRQLIDIKYYPEEEDLTYLPQLSHENNMR